MIPTAEEGGASSLLSVPGLPHKESRKLAHELPLDNSPPIGQLTPTSPGNVSLDTRMPCESENAKVSRMVKLAS
jgi:hypothetical protein